MAMRWLALCVLLMTGCLRRDGSNAECRWPGMGIGSLSSEVEFAEDLAIRYADKHFGQRTPGWVSGERYVLEREKCRATLYQTIATERQITAKDVLAAMGANRWWIDLLTNLPYLGLCAVASWMVGRWVWRQYPPSDYGEFAGWMASLVAAFLFSGGATLLGELWSWFWEELRIGNAHMSYRAERLAWSQYRSWLFGLEFLIFLAGPVYWALRSSAGKHKLTPC
jgi:hypothetical protein